MDRTDQTDRNRLEQIQQTDLTESRVNQDFVDWLKTKGVNWALVVLVVLCGVMGWNLWKQRQQSQRDEAWVDLASATIPAALEDVAARFPKVDSIAPLALLSAADKYLFSVQTGTRFDRDPTAEDYRLTPEVRTEWLQLADGLYAKVIETTPVTAEDFPRKGFVIAAMFGRAAVAECSGDIEAARTFLKDARLESEPQYPQLAALADERLETLDPLSDPVLLPTRAQLPQAPTATPIETPILDQDLIRDLLSPTAPTDGGTPPVQGTGFDLDLGTGVTPPADDPETTDDPGLLDPARGNDPSGG